MPPTCTICPRPDRKIIDKAILSGKSLRGIMRQTGADHDAIGRHRSCIAAALERAENREAITARNLVLEMAEDLREFCRAGKANGSIPQYLAVADRLNRVADTLGRITGEISSSQVTALFVELGVQNQAEIRSALDLARAGERMNRDDMQAAGVELLLDVIAQEPERRLAILEALAGTMQEVTSGNGNRHETGSAEPD